MVEIRAVKSSEWTDAMALAWRTFLLFEAPEYSPEGVRNFYKFVTDENLEKMFLVGEYKAFGAFVDGEIKGIIGVRNHTHVSLLFVEEEYHHQGIATALLDYFLEYLQYHDPAEFITVNSSPYAVGFYHYYGFEDLSGEKTEDGIRFTPMKKKCK